MSGYQTILRIESHDASLTEMMQAGLIYSPGVNYGSSAVCIGASQIREFWASRKTGAGTSCYLVGAAVTGSTVVKFNVLRRSDVVSSGYAWRTYVDNSPMALTSLGFATSADVWAGVYTNSSSASQTIQTIVGPGAIPWQRAFTIDGGSYGTINVANAFNTPSGFFTMQHPPSPFEINHP